MEAGKEDLLVDREGGGWKEWRWHLREEKRHEVRLRRMQDIGTETTGERSLSVCQLTGINA